MSMAPRQNRPRITVHPRSEYERHRLVFEALAELFPVEFAASEEGSSTPFSASILFGHSRREALDVAASGNRTLAYVVDPGTVQMCGSGEIKFSSALSLAPEFRDRSLPHGAFELASCAKPLPGDTVLASSAEHVLWFRTARRPNLDIVVVAPPRLLEREYLFQLFNTMDWIRMLPLLHFLKAVAGCYRASPRACFMFDDPNLHWKSYGYVKFDRLLQHAKTHNYHVAFATVPLDAWYANKATAALFRENADRLSLLVHGNNHTRKELAEHRSDDALRAMGAQALFRTRRLEKAAGLKISRVMAAPHGACSEATAAILLRMGFEAACISRGSIMAHNPEVVWSRSVGLRPAEFLGGLPVIPRFGLRADSLTEILFASFLGQAIISVWHHEDLANGLDVLAKVASRINSVGTVEWMNLENVARSNHSCTPSGSRLQLRLYSRHVRLCIPEGIDELSIERPWLRPEEGEQLTVETADGSIPVMALEQSYKVQSGTAVEIRSVIADPIDPTHAGVDGTPLLAVGRRCLCEVRDRFRPVIDSIRYGPHRISNNE